MRLTPIEIRRHRFSSRVRGFDRDEVRTFLDMVISDFEDVVRENAELRRDTERMVRELRNYQGREENIRDTLTTAQGLVQELKRTASKEAEVIVAEAEVQAEKTVQQAETQRSRVQEEIVQLRHLRERLGMDLRSTVEGYLSLIEAHQSSRPSRPPLIEVRSGSSAGAKRNAC